MNVTRSNMVLALFFILGSTSSALSQKFKFGIHATPIVSYLSTDMPDAETGGKLQFGFGGIVEYRFAERYALSSGFEVINRGAELELNDTIADYNPGYLQFPILLKMRTREFGYLTYNAEFGLVPAFRTSDGVTFDPDISNNQRIDTYVNFFNTIFRFGIGAEYSLGGESSVLVSLNYNRSLFDNIRADDPRLSERFNYRLDYVALSFGFLF